MPSRLALRIAAGAMTISLLGGMSAAGGINAVHAGGGKVAFVSDVGGLNDKGFNETSYAGTQAGAKKIGDKAIAIESTAPTDYARNISTAAQEAGLVIVAGFAMGPAIQQASKQFPHTKFAIIDYSYSPPLKNVQGDVFMPNESSYLAGIVAAGISKTGTIGFVGGVNVTLIQNFLAGYEQGALSYNPHIHIKVAYTGSFTDQQAGKNDANTEIANHADVIYTAAGASGLGGIAAAKQHHVWAIGVDTDQHSIAPNTVVTSVIKRVDVAAENNVVAYGHGTWKPGTRTFDLKNNGVGLAPYHNLASKVPKQVKKAVKRAEKAIKSGKIKVNLLPKYPKGR